MFLSSAIFPSHVSLRFEPKDQEMLHFGIKYTKINFAKKI
jgi:hypothetical protein